MTRRVHNSARTPSQAEIDARRAIEAGLSRPLPEEEWARMRTRLLEFVNTLARWDRHQREGRAGQEIKLASAERKTA